MNSLVIHAIPEGMVAVIRHTVHGLLLAELSGRRPVIYWGKRFLYRRKNVEGNAFLHFFKDSGYCDTNAAKLTYEILLPTCWNVENIFNDSLITYRANEIRAEVAQPSLEAMLSSKADIVVYTHWNHLVDILPFVPKNCPYFGLDNATVAGMIFKKYFQILPEILAPADVWLNAANSEGKLIGVHCRGSDKVTEHALVTPEDYRRGVDRILRKEDRVVLATDSESALEKFRAWYGDRLIFIDCERSANTQGVHFTARDLEKAGSDFLLDAYLLSKCAVHFGNEGSHVSYLVQAMLKEQGQPYDNFINVRASSLSRMKRNVLHRFPAWGRKKLGNSLRRVGLRGQNNLP